MNVSRSEDLVARHFDAALGSSEREELDQLLVDDPAVAQLFARHAYLHAALQRHAQDQAAGPQEIIEFPQNKNSGVSPFIRFASVAAILCVALLAFVFFSQQSQQAFLMVKSGSVTVNDRAIQHKTAIQAGQYIHTDASSLAILTLTDGSEITVQANSKIRYVTDNKIVLEEAIIRCDINKRSEKNRLIIGNEVAEVQVIGTAFSMEFRNEICNVHVDHGLVHVSTNHQAEAIALTGSDSLQVSNKHLVSSAQLAQKTQSPNEILWQVNFESGKLPQDCIIGEIIPKPLMPDGNNSAYCMSAQSSTKYDHALLQLVLKSKNDTYFVADPDAYVCFRYWANDACGWVGVWMASLPANHYLFYHREFVPITGKWMTARVRLRDCVRGMDSRSSESLAEGDPVYWIMIQSGNVPGAKLLIDDLRVEVPVK
ncbi:MAG: FecR domain-containing protein [Planctomycetes bacterium]|nr:FecR domain-containing protein [Planctomycetota bacterium]